MDEQLDPRMDTLWAKVLDDWDSPAVHDAFITASVESGTLGAAAARYRAQKENPEREALAKKKLEAVAFLAMQALEVDKTPPSKSAPRWVTLTAAIAAALGLAWLIYTLSQ